MSEINKRILQIADYYNVVKPADFAKKTGFSHQVASNYLKGTRIPNAEALCIIKQMFDISADWLLTGEGEMLNGDKKEPVSVKETDKSIIYSIDKISALERELGRKEAEVDFLKMRIKELESGSSYSKASGFRSVPSVDTSNPSQTREKAK